MTEQPQKNRYLHLDGDVVGAPYWKKLCLSKAFISAAFATCISTALAEDIYKNKATQFAIMTGALVFVTIQTAKTVAYSKTVLSAQSKELTPDYVIDTQPEQSATAEQQKLAKYYATTSKTYGGQYALASAAIPAYMCYKVPTIDPAFLMSITAPAVIPFFVEAIENFRRASNVGTSKWNIIHKNQMTMDTSSTAAPLQPT